MIATAIQPTTAQFPITTPTTAAITAPGVRMARRAFIADTVYTFSRRVGSVACPRIPPVRSSAKRPAAAWQESVPGQVLLEPAGVAPVPQHPLEVDLHHDPTQVAQHATHLLACSMSTTLLAGATLPPPPRGDPAAAADMRTQAWNGDRSSGNIGKCLVFRVARARPRSAAVAAMR